MAEMAEFQRFGALDTADILSPTVRDILVHLCRGECHTYGAVVEWCESRGDCCYAVVCPGCSMQFLVDEEELSELRGWTNTEGQALVCGVNWE